VSRIFYFTAEWHEIFAGISQKSSLLFTFLRLQISADFGRLPEFPFLCHERNLSFSIKEY